MIVNDNLKALLGGLGDPLRDKAAGIYYDYPFLTDIQLLNMYRGSWIPRKIVNIPAHDTVRAWRNWQAEDDQITAIEAEEKRLGLKQKIKEAKIKARLFGGSLIYIGTGKGGDMMKPLTPEEIKKDGIRYLTVLSKFNVGTPELEYDPESEFFQQPKRYTIGTTDYHPSRFIRFTGADVPEHSFALPGMGGFGWGDSVLLAAHKAVTNLDASTANVASLIFEANVDVIRVPDLLAQVHTEKFRSALLERMTLAAVNKGVNRSLLMDKEEEYDRKQIAFSNLPELLQVFMQSVSGASDIPATRFMGMSPAGMSATGESDLRNYYDGINADQELDLQPRLYNFDEMLIRSALGNRPEEIFYEWAPLWQLSAKEIADIGKITAETATSLVNSNLVQPEAISNSVVNALTEHGVFPGLESEVAALPEIDFEAQAQEEKDRQAAELAARSKLTADMAPKPLYVSRKVKNGKAIHAWAKSVGFEQVTPLEDLHVTIVFSRAPLDWFEIGESWTAEIKIPAGGPRVVEQFGSAVVLRFQSSELKYRREAILNAGASTDFEEYKPHITITWQLPGTIDNVENIEPYQGEIVLGPEIFEPIAEDWKQRIRLVKP